MREGLQRRCSSVNWFRTRFLSAAISHIYYIHPSFRGHSRFWTHLFGDCASLPAADFPTRQSCALRFGDPCPATKDRETYARSEYLVKDAKDDMHCCVYVCVCLCLGTHHVTSANSTSRKARLDIQEAPEIKSWTRLCRFVKPWRVPTERVGKPPLPRGSFSLQALTEIGRIQRQFFENIINY